MSKRWAPILAELEARNAASRAMGGAERLDRQRAASKLNARLSRERAAFCLSNYAWTPK